MNDDLVKRLRDWEHVWPQDLDEPEGGLYIKAADRIEELEAKLAEYKHVASAIDTQWAESQDEIADLKANLAKVLEALGEAIYLLDPDEEDIAKETGLHRIVTTYAELTGGKDD